MSKKGKDRIQTDETRLIAESIRLGLVQAFANPALQDIVRQGVENATTAWLDKILVIRSRRGGPT